MVMGPKQVAEWLAQLEKDNAKQGNKLQLLNQDQQKQQPEALTLASLHLCTYFKTGSTNDKIRN